MVMINTIGKYKSLDLGVYQATFDEDLELFLGYLPGGQEVYLEEAARFSQMTFFVVEPRKRKNKTTLSLVGILKPGGILTDLILAASPENKVKAHDFYRWLIVKHNYTLVGKSHSPGAISVWKKLSKFRNVSVHGWHKGEPVNIKPDGENDDEIWGYKSDTSRGNVRYLELIATKKIKI